MVPILSNRVHFRFFSKSFPLESVEINVFTIFCSKEVLILNINDFIVLLKSNVGALDVSDNIF